MKFKYSQEFKKLIGEKTRVKSLIEGSEVRGANFEDWERIRSFIAKVVDRDGTLLDIGCANGFLLRCLQEWSRKRLIPYGIDTNKAHIESARKLFSSYKYHFMKASIEELPSSFFWKFLWTIRFGTPFEYDMIFWNVWDNRDFKNKGDEGFLKKALSVTKTNGRLILGFYHASQKSNLKRIKNLENLGYKLEGIIKNKTGSEVVTWIDKVLQFG